MKEITKQELKDVQPLLQPESIASEHETVNAHETMDETNALEEEPFQFINGKVLVREPEIISTLQELENMHEHVQDESSEEEQDEDENLAREALNKMLEEFGDVFN
jgi:hypothetical protein